MNISSIVVQCLPKYVEEVVQSLKDCEVCDYHMHDEKGRVIITIEGKGVSEELEKLKVVESIAHVIAADMQMAYSEDELDEHMEVINNANVVPKILRDTENYDIDKVVYNGDMKKKEDMIAFAKEFDAAKEREK
ncbi:MAG: chaperone NapD [Epsilonproteobacteria bacterium]|nr:chaperone NapD [Campylobacterota bacterium]